MVSKMFRSLILLTCLVFSAVVVNCAPEVELLHVLFRHGEKVPQTEFQNYPNDPHRNHSYYPALSGGLTIEGKMREYKIGRMLRERYDKFFGPDYTPDAIDASSTALARTQMSLQLVLAGLFPPVGHQVWNPDLLWQPVSVTSELIKRDFLLFPQDNCQLYGNEYKKFLKHDEPRRLIQEYNATLAYLTEKTGKLVNTTDEVMYLYNLLKEQQLNNLTLPEWTKSVYPSLMAKITILNFDLQSFTTKLKRLGGGMLLKKITDDIKDFSGGCLRPLGRKAFLFGAHEWNVAALARTLGTRDPQQPAYGSAIIIETLQDRENGGKYFVRVLHWTGVTERLITQTIPGCSEVCPLEEFLRLLKYVIPTEYEYSFCKRNPNSGSKLFSNDICLLAGLAVSVGLSSSYKAY